MSQGTKTMKTIAEVFQPMGNRVLVLRDAAEDRTKGGIIIPENAKDKPKTGKVVAVGPEVADIGHDDRVLFSNYAGSEIEINGVTYLVMAVEEIIGRML